MNRTTLFYEIILNDDIFRQLKELLNNTHIGTNHLLDVTRYFKDLKKEIFYWELKRQYSMIYYSSSLYEHYIAYEH
jgi:hypothetical protein